MASSSSCGDDGGVAGDVGEGVVRRHDLLDVLGEEVVLRAPCSELGVGVDEEHLAATLRRLRSLRSQHEDAGGDAGAVEEVGRQADDRVEEVVVEQALADLSLGAAAEEHAVRHDRGDRALAAGARRSCAART